MACPGHGPIAFARLIGRHHRHYEVNLKSLDWQRKQDKLFEYPKSGLDMVFITLRTGWGFMRLSNFSRINQAAELRSN